MRRPVSSPTFELGDLTIDLTRREVRRGAELVDSLTPREADLLAYLAAHPGPVRSEDILVEVFGYAPAARTNTLRTTVGRLRAKVEEDPRDPRWLVTERGVGYRLEVPDAPNAPGPLAAGNVRARMGPWVERGELVAQVFEAFEGGARLLTLVGPPGIGKTALAERVAHSQRASGQAAWMCALGDARHAEEIADVVVGTTGVSLEPGQSLVQALGARTPCTLVLDRAEGALDEVAELASEWLGAHPELTVLVTSRERLGVRGERVIRVGPLAEGETQQLARALLVARGGEISDTQVERVARRSQGVPLGVELLAAGSARGDSSRRSQDASAPELDHLHAATAGLVEESWDLLDAPERTALAQASVLAGPFDLDLAEVIIDLSPFGVSVRRALRLLRQASLVEGISEMRLLDLIRDFAAGRLESREAVEGRYLAWAHHVATTCPDWRPSRDEVEPVLPHLASCRNIALRRRHDAGYVITAAIAFARIDAGRTEEAARLVRHTREVMGPGTGVAPAALHLVDSELHVIAGRLREALAAARAAAATADECGHMVVSVAAHARTLGVLGMLGHSDEIVQIASTLVARAEATGDDAILSRALRARAASSRRGGRLDLMVRDLRRADGLSVELAPEVGMLAWAFVALGEAKLLRPLAAREALGRVSEALEVVSRGPNAASASTHAGHAATLIGDVELAHHLCDISHGEAIRFGADPGRVTALSLRAMIHLVERKTRTALATLEACAELIHQARLPHEGFLAVLTHVRAATWLDVGHHEQARVDLDTALRILGDEPLYGPSIRLVEAELLALCAAPDVAIASLEAVIPGLLASGQRADALAASAILATLRASDDQLGAAAHHLDELNQIASAWRDHSWARCHEALARGSLVFGRAGVRGAVDAALDQVDALETCSTDLRRHADIVRRSLLGEAPGAYERVTEEITGL